MSNNGSSLNFHKFDFAIFDLEVNLPKLDFKNNLLDGINVIQKINNFFVCNDLNQLEMQVYEFARSEYCCSRLPVRSKFCRS